jgi:hypothetical protein
LNLCGIYSILKGTDLLDISAGGIPATTPLACQRPYSNQTTELAKYYLLTLMLSQQTKVQ